MARPLRVAGVAVVIMLVSCNAQAEDVGNRAAVDDEPRRNFTTEEVALSQFGMVIKTEGGQSFSEDDFVVSKGVVLPSWTASCRSSAKTTDGERICTIRSFDEYQDQVALEFLYNDPDLYQFRRPKIIVVGGRAHPQIRDFSNDVEEKSGEITILHGCTAVSRGHVVTSQVSLSFPITDNGSVALSWDKKCGYGRHKKFDYGWFSGSADKDIRKPISLKDSDSEEAAGGLVTFGPRTLSTRLYLALLDGAKSQHFDAPVVSAKGRGPAEAVGVELRGANFGGAVQAGSYTVFDVMYSCVGNGVSDVTATVAIPPFDPLVMKWRKDCGGGVARPLQVSTTAPMWTGRSGFGEVVQNGSAIDGYAAALEGKSRRGRDGTAVRQRMRTAARRFFVWTRDESGRNEEDDGEEVGEISAHSSDERVGMAGVAAGSVIGVGGVTGLGEHGGRVRNARVVRVWTRCTRRGWVRVRVTMTVRDRRPVEWWFDDQCTRERLRKRGASGMTAGSVMYLTLAMFAVVMGAWLFKGIKAKGKEEPEVNRMRRTWRSV